MKSVNFQTCPPITPNKPKMGLPLNKTVFTIQRDTLKSLSSIKKSSSHFLSHCSTKPDTFTSDQSVSESSSNRREPSTSSNLAVSSCLGSPSRGLVLDLGIKGSWDSAEIGSPVVKRFLSDDEERWFMWYHGRSTLDPLESDSIGIAISSNGVHWERGLEGAGSGTGVGRVMGCGEDWWAFDTKNVRPSEVMIMSSSKVRASNAVYWLYYTGFSSEGVAGFCNEEVLSSLPGVAISQDGRHWARIEGEDHSGALLGLGVDGEWDSLFIASPHVVIHSSKDIRMYYHSFDPNTKRFAIGMARSRDGLKWVKLGKIMEGGKSDVFDELGALNGCVVRDKKDGSYLMAYEGVGLDRGRSIGMAVSSDGLTGWRRVSDEPILKPLMDDGWDCKGVGSPYLVQIDGSKDEQLRLYYRGIGVDGKTGIGMAVCDAALRFRRWVGFRL